MKTTLLALAMILDVVTRVSGADQFQPPLSLAKAAQIADAALSQAKLPAGEFLRSIRIQYLPDQKYCYIASYEPPVLQGWVAGSQPKPRPITVHYLQVNMDGTTSFQTKTITPGK